LSDLDGCIIDSAESDQRCTTYNLWFNNKRESLLGSQSLGSFQPFKRFFGFTII